MRLRAAVPLGHLLLAILTGPLAPAVEPVNPQVRATPNGTTEFHFQSHEELLYVLHRSFDVQENGEPVDMALGQGGPLTLRDRFRNLPQQAFYRIETRTEDQEIDTDLDGRTDWREMHPTLFVPDRPSGNPFNPVKELKHRHGSYHLTEELWDAFAVRPGSRGITPGLTGSEFVKFVILPLHDPWPVALFMNTRRFNVHGEFLPVMTNDYKIPNSGELRGEMARVENEDDNGRPWYLYNLQPGNVPTFEQIRLTYQLLTKNMPFIEGNLAYRPIDSTLLVYRRDQHLFEAEGIPVWLDEERPGFHDYVPLNEGEAYGLLRVFDPDERPSILDVAIYRQLPNDVPLLRGIITETPQTPLSHVNLRAVQNHNPNAYIRGASELPEIAQLIGKYVRYRVTPEGFEIEEVSLETVEAQLKTIRPPEKQTPNRDLTARQVLPLDQLGFDWTSSIGAKAANVAELMNSTAKTGIPRNIFPEMGFAVPFSFYHDFMEHNGFYDDAASMIEAPSFQEDPEAREEALKAFRKKVRGGSMPTWMLDALAEVQSAFPEGQGIRCRSSTNNEDLPGFNGAGLYESFTHRPDEGHLSKSVKQVFASLWRFLAYEHREFYRVDHFQAAMGVLMHPNYDDEIANGVAVSRHDYGDIAIHPYYANVQVGENLITNPDLSSRPEELLLSYETQMSRGISPVPIRFSASNLVPLGEHILSDSDGQRIARYLDRIVRHFRRLYDAPSDFAMEIEFKVTVDDELAIKQARPWVN